VSIHLTHASARMAELEAAGAMTHLESLRSAASVEGVAECAVVKTCNRVEAYAIAPSEEARLRLRSAVAGWAPGLDPEKIVVLEGEASARHLMRVASGLESMVLGEDQVQSQVKEAFRLASREGTAGPKLSLLFRSALSAGKKVRTCTCLSKGRASVGSAAVELAESKVGSLEGRQVLIVGAGETAELISKHLIGKRPKAVLVGNRTYERAVEMAAMLGGRAVHFDELVEHMGQADVILVATSASHRILDVERARRAMGMSSGRKLIIDVSFPRNVDPAVGEIPGVDLCDLDSLRGLARENALRRERAASEASRIIDLELETLREDFGERGADVLLGELYRSVHAIKEREMRKAASRLESGADPEAVLSDFAEAMASRFLAGPTERLKEASREGDSEMLEMAREILMTGGGSVVPK